MSEQKEKKDYLIVKLIAGVVIGLLIGLKCDEKSIQVFMSIKQILGQIIFYAVPLVIVGFITPAITGLKQNANKLLTTALIIAYVSSIGAAFMSMIAGYIIIPNLDIVSDVAGTKELPEILFSLSIPPMFPVMTALVTSIIFGLAIIWTKSELMEKLFIEFNNIMMLVVQKIVVPILPFFVASTFATLAYEGAIIHQFPVFIKAIIIVIVMHYIWLAVLYGIGGTISKSNPFEVLKHYGPAYLTAVGTMSSAATLPVSLECARKSSVLDREIVDFAVPIGATIKEALLPIFEESTVTLTGNSLAFFFSIVISTFSGETIPVTPVGRPETEREIVCFPSPNSVKFGVVTLYEPLLDVLKIKLLVPSRRKETESGKPVTEYSSLLIST